MAQKKGKTGNPNGRPNGSENKVTKQTKEWITAFLQENVVLIEEYLKNLPERERLEALLTFIPKILPYVLPKQQESTVNLHEEKYLKIMEAQKKINDLFKFS